jgi:hypothetical protein
VTGPIEIAWDDDTWLSLDAKSDWTLEVSSRQWVDPYANVSAAEFKRLAGEVGIWEQASIPPGLDQLVGQVVIAAAPKINEVGELTGVSLAFLEQVLVARVLGGELSIDLTAR